MSQKCCCTCNCPKEPVDPVEGQLTTSKFVGKNWNITLPTSKDGKKPTTIEFPELETYNDDNYQLFPNYIRMVAPCDGFTTPNSSYCRTEFRELINGEKAAWDGTTGLHEMTYKFKAITLPVKKPDVCIGQIHDEKDDLIELRVEGEKLVVRGKLFTGYVVVDDAFKLDQEYNAVLGSDKGSVFIIVNNFKTSLKAAKITSKKCYFKVGNYVQSNASKGDKGNKSEIHLYSAKVVHSTKIIKDKVAAQHFDSKKRKSPEEEFKEIVHEVFQEGMKKLRAREVFLD